MDFFGISQNHPISKIFTANNSSHQPDSNYMQIVGSVMSFSLVFVINQCSHTYINYLPNNNSSFGENDAKAHH